MDILVLCGGLSAERDVSISGGIMAAAALRRRGHNAALVDLLYGYTLPYNSPHEIFNKSFYDISAVIGETAPEPDAFRQHLTSDRRIGDNVLELCQAADIVFVALHGEDGEDGKIQAALDLLGVKYTGTGVLGSALAMNKNLSKQILAQNNIRTPRGTVVRRAEKQISDTGFPCVVKPCCGGSSVGTSIVRVPEELDAALELAFRYGDEVIAEQYITGRECNVGVLAGNSLPVIEIRTKSGFFDYKNKYQQGMAEEICPADLPHDVTVKLQREAERVFKALRFDVYGRMDFIVDADGECWCLEGNTLPGITANSLLPKEAAAAGIAYDELCEIIVTESLKKYEVNRLWNA